MGALGLAPHAPRAHRSLVEGEPLPGLEPDRLVVAHLELDAALLAAEAAMGLDQPVRWIAGLLLVAAGRGVGRVRAVPRHRLVVGEWRLSQRAPLVRRAAAAGRWRATPVCRPGRGPASCR